MASNDDIKETLEIGIIGLGDMGLMYAKRMIAAGWKKYETFIFLYRIFSVILIKLIIINRVNVCDQLKNYEHFKELLKG